MPRHRPLIRRRTTCLACGHSVRLTGPDILVRRCSTGSKPDHRYEKAACLVAFFYVLGSGRGAGSPAGRSGFGLSTIPGGHRVMVDNADQYQQVEGRVNE